MLGGGDLVEHRAFGAGDGAIVVGAAALLQALERLALPRGLAQRVATCPDFGVVAVKVVLAGLANLLHPFEVGLVGGEVGGARRPSGRGRALRVERAGDLLAHRTQPLGAALLAVQRTGKLLLGEILAALAQRPQALEGEAERRHGPVVGPAGTNWRG